MLIIANLLLHCVVPLMVLASMHRSKATKHNPILTNLYTRLHTVTPLLKN